MPDAAVPPEPVKRPRGAGATKAAILRAACTAFARVGYDGAGVREIAAAAGVTAMMVNRYFGSKEALFAAAADAAFTETGHLLHHAAALGRTLTHGIVARPASEPGGVDPLLLILRSAPNPRAAAILRDCVARHVEQPLAALMPGSDPEPRAALVLAAVLGFLALRDILGSAALEGADEIVLRDRFAAQLRVLTEPGG